MSSVPHLNTKWMLEQAAHAATIRAFIKTELAKPAEEQKPITPALTNIVRLEVIPKLEMELENEKQKILSDRGAIATLEQQLRDLHSNPSLGHDAILASLQ